MASDDRDRTDPIDEARQQYLVTEHAEGVAAGDPTAGPPPDDRPDDDAGAPRDEGRGGDAGKGENEKDSTSGGSISMMTLLAAGALALVFGFIGAWLYGALLGGSDEAKSGEQASQQQQQQEDEGNATGSADSSAAGSSADRSTADDRDLPAGERPGAYGVDRNGGDSDRVDQLADQVEQLRTMIEERPRPASADDIEQLRGDLDAVHETVKGLQDLPDRVQAIASSVDAVNAKLRGHIERFDEVADRTDAMESDLTAVRDKVEAATGDIGGGLLDGSTTGDALGGPRSSRESDRGPAAADTASLRRPVRPDAGDDGGPDSAIERGLRSSGPTSSTRPARPSPSCSRPTRATRGPGTSRPSPPARRPATGRARPSGSSGRASRSSATARRRRSPSTPPSATCRTASAAPGSTTTGTAPAAVEVGPAHSRLC